MLKPDLIRLRHMREAAAYAQEMAASRTRSDLDENVLLRMALIHCLEILGEAASRVTPETRAQLPSIPFGLSQADFAALFGFNVRSLQDWEQSRRRPEIPIRAYLAVIDRDPQAVIRALRAA